MGSHGRDTDGAPLSDALAMSSYGKKLDDHTYQQRALALAEQAGIATARQRAMLRRDELDLTIDHRLGIDFPADRRESLWRAQQHIHRWHLPVLAWGLIRKGLGSRLPPDTWLYRLVLRAYSQALSSAELSVMVDLPVERTVTD